jgi:hypothetical protein
MSKKVTHIIHKLNLEINVPDERLARSMYQRAGSILQEYVLPQLEILLKQYDKDGLHVRLDKLDIDLNTDRSSSFEETIKEQLAAAIAKELETVIRTAESKVEQANKPTKKPVREHERITEAFLWFLEWGTLPWWISDNTTFANSQEIIDAITHSEETFVALFIKKLEASPVMQKRLFLQCDAVLLTYLFSLVVPLEIFTMVDRYEQKAAELLKGETERSRRQQYWAQVWSLYPARELLMTSSEELEKRLDQLLVLLNKTIKQEAAQQSPGQFTETLATELFFLNRTNEQAKEKPESKAKTDKADYPEAKLPETEDGLLGSNAGLVLLHPFLQYFFKELGLLEGERFLNNASGDVAVHLLHYLATGKEHAADFDLVFEKYLCGMHAGQVTYRFVTLTEQMKKEADTLLQSVIKHWSVLRNTSVAGLREGFLQRKGKLVVAGNNSRIIMEQNTLDILLQQVPWNISLLKLPWMDHLIHVEWMNPT